MLRFVDGEERAGSCRVEEEGCREGRLHAVVAALYEEEEEVEEECDPAVLQDKSYSMYIGGLS